MNLHISKSYINLYEGRMEDVEESFCLRYIYNILNKLKHFFTDRETV